MDNQREHYKHIWLFYFRKGKNAVQAQKKLCHVYCEAALLNASVSIGSLTFILKILMCKMHHILVLLMMTKYRR